MDLSTRRHRPARAQLLASLVVAAAMLCVLASQASAALVDNPGCTASTLAANDDGSTGLVSIGFPVSFFGAAYDELYVNNNGNVTFDHSLGQYTPFDFSITGDVIIAPFLADIDTTGAGSSVVTYGQTTFDGQPAFCVNWKDVGYFSSQFDKLNSIQLLLVKRGNDGGFDIIFNYDKIQWETGSASGGSNGFGGTPAAWGFSNGDGDESQFFVGPGSFTSRALLDGGPAALIAGTRNTSPPVLGRYIFPVTASGPIGPKLSGEVTAPGGVDPVPFAPVQICPVGGGTCITRTTNSEGIYRAFGLNGSYNLTAFPVSGSNTPGRAGPVTITTADVTQDIVLGPAPAPPPDDTTITNIGTGGNGIPVAYWNDPLTLTTHGCTGGTATYQMTLHGSVVRSGSMAEGPAGTYTATIAALAPDHGDGLIHIAIACPTPTDDEAFDFGIYIDPSGLVRNSLGAPVSGATVVLLRSGTPTGTFAPVPDGSAVMSPSNRDNPDSTSSDGRFGWDVVAGYYKVRASKDGCVSNTNRSSAFAESAVLTIPPPVTDLDLRLFCGEGVVTPPPPPPVAPPPPPPDTIKPNLSALKLSSKTFKVSSAATAVAAAVKTKSGSRFTFTLSERATVVLTIARKSTGRKVGKSCLKLSRANRKRTPCTRYVTAGKLTRSNLPAGANSVAFSGRIGSKKLAPGSYRVIAVPTDAAQNQGTPRQATFKIVRR